MKGGLVAAFLFAFITSFDELTIAIFVSGGIKTTLPKQMWDDMILQLNPTAGGGVGRGLRDRDRPSSPRRAVPPHDLNLTT